MNYGTETRNCSTVIRRCFGRGRMSIAAGMVVRSDALRLSAAIELLDDCREGYDAIIFEEARTRK